jgi:RNA polymerase sigma factor (sigma-70 family)
MLIPSAHATEARLLSAAQHGDARAFDALVAPHRADIHRLCYRMLGSPYDGDDAVQEALLRAWRALPRFDGRSAIRTWLYRIALNVRLNAAARRRRRVLPIDDGDHGGEGLQERATSSARRSSSHSSRRSSTCPRGSAPCSCCATS